MATAAGISSRSTPAIPPTPAAVADVRHEVTEAFENTPPDYLDQCFAQRNPGPKAVGSIFQEPQSRQTLLEANWSRFKHPHVAPPYRSYRAEIPGALGVICLHELYPLSYLRLADTLKNGQIKPIVIIPRYQRELVGHTTLIVGPDPPSGLNRIWSFHPGDPVPPPPPQRARFDGELVSVNDAHAMGFEWADVDAG